MIKKSRQKIKFKEENRDEEENNFTRFCVESKEYYRRDNYKIMEKMERMELKKRGLYHIDFNRNGQNEIMY